MKFLEVIKDYLIEDYRNYSAVNYSLLKEINNGNFRAIRDGIPERSSIYLDFGSYIDKVVSNGKNPDVFVYEDVEVTGHSEVLVKELVRRNIFSSDLFKRVEVANELNLWASTKNEVKRLELCNSKEINIIINKEFNRKEGKEVISDKDLALANYILDVLYTHEYSKNILVPKEGIENYNQLALKFNFNGVNCKVLLDTLQINEKEKTLQPIDLKTGTDFNFLNNYYKYNYFLQGTFYYLGCLNLINKVQELKDFTILPFQFLYISRENPNLPLKYTIPQKAIEKYTDGYMDIKNTYRKGIIDLLENYKFHKETGIFDISEEIYKDKGVVILPDPV